MRPPGLPFWRDHFCCLGRPTSTCRAAPIPTKSNTDPNSARRPGPSRCRPRAAARVAAVLRRLANMPAEGWFAGDLHIHRPPADMPVLVLSSDIQIAPVITLVESPRPPGNRTAIRPAGQDEIRVGKDHFMTSLAGEDEREGGGCSTLAWNGRCLSDTRRRIPVAAAFCRAGPRSRRPGSTSRNRSGGTCRCGWPAARWIPSSWPTITCAGANTTRARPGANPRRPRPAAAERERLLGRRRFTISSQ